MPLTFILSKRSQIINFSFHSCLSRFTIKLPWPLVIPGHLKLTAPASFNRPHSIMVIARNAKRTQNSITVRKETIPFYWSVRTVCCASLCHFYVFFIFFLFFDEAFFFFPFSASSSSPEDVPPSPGAVKRWTIINFMLRKLGPTRKHSFYGLISLSANKVGVMVWLRGEHEWRKVGRGNR